MRCRFLCYYCLLLLFASHFLTGAAYAASGGSAISTDTVNYTKGGTGGVNGDAAAARGKETILPPNGKTYGGGGGAVNIGTGQGMSGGSRIWNNSGILPDGITGATGHNNPAIVSTGVTGGAGTPAGAGGGGGGVGVSTIHTLTVTGTAVIAGGKGGNGQGSSGGGGGGVGLFSSNDVLIEAGAIVTGGAGGLGANASGGGGGAAGVLVNGNATLVNNGFITGGLGGGVNTSPLMLPLGGAGGDGGEGVLLTNGGRLINEVGGTITGGVSGVSGSKIDLFGVSASYGGIGISGNNVSVLNKGAINGGATYTGGMGEAALFTGGINQLELWASSQIQGNVQAFSRSDRLLLGGADNGVFAVSDLGDNAQYRGFGQFEKIGSSRWELSGLSFEQTPWILTEGVLSIAQDESLGDVIGQLTFNGGTLQVTQSFESEREVYLTPRGGSVDVSANIHLKIQSVIGGAGQLTKRSDGVLVLSADNLYTGGTIIKEGILQLGDGSATGNIQGDVLNDGTLIFNRSHQALFVGSISGSGSVHHIGEGATHFSGTHDYQGETRIEAGRLVMERANSLSTNSAHIVEASAELDLYGHSQTIASLVNNGKVKLGGDHERVGTQLIITGNYHGNGGILELNAALADDRSPTDVLVIQGDSSGTSHLIIHNLNETGAVTQEGIKIVEVKGTSEGRFLLLGDYEFEGEKAIVSGAHSYRLYQNGIENSDDGHWYLRSAVTTPSVDPVEPLYNPATPVFETYASALLDANEVATLQQRVGNRYRDGIEATQPMSAGLTSSGSPFWGRLEAAHLKVRPKHSTTAASYKSDKWKLEVGLDGQFYDNASGMLIGGLTAHAVRTSMRTYSKFGNGKTDIRGYGLGATLTWYGTDGFYMDGQAQATWYESDLFSADLNRQLTHDNQAFGYAISSEIGQRIALDPYWSIIPQAQLSYSAVDFDRFETRFLSGHSYTGREKAARLEGRLGVVLDYKNNWFDENGDYKSINIYSVANIYRDFLNGTEVEVSGVRFSQQNTRHWLGIGAGGSYQWNQNQSSLYGEVSMNAGFDSFVQNYKFKGRIGYKLSF